MSIKRSSSAGFSLVEVLVALALFALIGSAGFTMLDQVMRTQRQTEGRLEKLAELQRAVHLIRVDFSHAIGASLAFDSDTMPRSLRFQRSNLTSDAAPADIVYALDNGILQRGVRQSVDEADTVQPLMRDVSAAQWRFFDPIDGWTDQWPPRDRQILSGQPSPNPKALELTVTLANRNEMLRRVVLLPAEAE